jgi:hypothetical protein
VTVTAAEKQSDFVHLKTIQLTVTAAITIPAITD